MLRSGEHPNVRARSITQRRGGAGRCGWTWRRRNPWSEYPRPRWWMWHPIRREVLLGRTSQAVIGPSDDRRSSVVEGVLAIWRLIRLGQRRLKPNTRKVYGTYRPMQAAPGRARHVHRGPHDGGRRNRTQPYVGVGDRSLDDDDTDSPRREYAEFRAVRHHWPAWLLTEEGRQTFGAVSSKVSESDPWQIEDLATICLFQPVHRSYLSTSGQRGQ